MLPGLDGLTVCRKLREEARNDTPLLMLTARDTLDDKINGLGAGRTTTSSSRSRSASSRRGCARCCVATVVPSRARPIPWTTDARYRYAESHAWRPAADAHAHRPEAAHRADARRATVVTRQQLEREVWGDCCRTATRCAATSTRCARRSTKRSHAAAAYDPGAGYRLAADDAASGLGARLGRAFLLQARSSARRPWSACSSPACCSRAC